jgi:hypothetical protein
MLGYVARRIFWAVPWCTFALLFAALYVRMIRASVLEALDEEYVRTARAKGASEGRVLFSHVLRNAMLPVVTMLGMDIGVALGGSIFTENVFDLHGPGWTMTNAISQSDISTPEEQGRAESSDGPLRLLDERRHGLDEQDRPLAVTNHDEGALRGLLITS